MALLGRLASKQARADDLIAALHELLLAVAEAEQRPGTAVLSDPPDDALASSALLTKGRSD